MFIQLQQDFSIYYLLEKEFSERERESESVFLHLYFEIKLI